MKHLLAFLCVLVLWLPPFLSAQETVPAPETTVYSTEREALSRSFPEAELFPADHWVFSEAERKALAEKLGRPVTDASIKVFRPLKAGQSLGWAVLTEEIGKYHPFTFLVAMNEKGEVRDVQVLVYRESRGGEIVKRRFLKQFEGKTLDDPVGVNKDIINITGATLSVRAICRGIRKSMTIVKETYIPGLREVPAKDDAKVPPGSSSPDSSGDGGPPPPQDDSGDSGLRSRSNSGTAVGTPPGPRPTTRGCRMVMGTLLSVSIYAASEGKAEGALQAAFVEAERWDSLLSDYRAETPIGELNREGAIRPVVLPRETFELLLRAFEIGRRSGGAFDVTVGPLVDCWRRARERGQPPGDDEIDAARERVGMLQVDLDPRAGTAHFATAGMRIDPGGIGKGTALDAMVRVLRDRGVTIAVIDFGGQWTAVGQPPAGGTWPVLVQSPIEDAQAVAWLAVNGGSVSTTSNVERFLEIAGTRYGHVIDPRTGVPANDLLSVTVADDSAERADAWSTALFVLGPEDGPRVAEREGIAAVFVSAAEGRKTRCTGTTALTGRWGRAEAGE